ncbi:cytochrome c oxidase subunit 4 [Streptomyces sp. NPDC047002]|uniref:aa3-type cytochrome oxidase subunit IV n=1 Tax=Streptomyces sp. NPDC047002 TaxID=3155475 RepID=UPI003456B9FC
MRREALLFAGVTLFFAVAAAIYGWWSYEPTGTAALIVAALMAALITFYLWYQYRRTGLRPEDLGDAEVANGAGPVGFFPPDTAYPVLTAAGMAVTAAGVVLGLWLFLLGAGVLLTGVCGFVFPFGDREN